MSILALPSSRPAPCFVSREFCFWSTVLKRDRVSMETHSTFIPTSVSVRARSMLRVHGYTDAAHVPSAITNTAETIAVLAERSFSPIVHYRKVAIRDCTNGVMTLETGTRFHCEAFSKFLSECSDVVVFLVTVGSSFDTVAQTLNKNSQILESLFLETAGWLGVEGVTRSFSQHLRELAARGGHRLTRRMAPGYRFKIDSGHSDWSLYEQKALFDLFEGVQLPIRILESRAMIPKMSRSGLYGLVPLP